MEDEMHSDESPLPATLNELCESQVKLLYQTEFSTGNYTGSKYQSTVLF